MITSFQNQFSIDILGHFNKAVVVIKEKTFITEREKLRNSLPSPSILHNDIVLGSAVAAMLNAIINAKQTLLRVVKTDIKQTDEVSTLFRS